MHASLDREGVRLPAGFKHPHASEEARLIAARGLILRTQAGSGMHGNVDQRSGRPRRDGQLPGTAGVRHRAGAGAERHQGRGTLDRLRAVRAPHRLGQADDVERFVSKLAVHRFLGHLQAQKAAMTGGVGAHTNRPELTALHGYDTKYAMYALRLGFQGVELLTTGRTTLPVPEPHRAYLRSIRRGELNLDEVVDAASAAEAELTRLKESSTLPQQPDRQWVDSWLHRSHCASWDQLAASD